MIPVSWIVDHGILYPLIFLIVADDRVLDTGLPGKQLNGFSRFKCCHPSLWFHLPDAQGKLIFHKRYNSPPKLRFRKSMVVFFEKKILFL